MPKKRGPTDSPELKAHKERAKFTVNQWMPEWAILMKAHKVSRIVIDYAGSGDDGGIEGVTYFNSKGDHMAAPIPQPTQEKFESFIYDVMNQREFYNQDAGSQGNIVWDIEKDTFIHHHEQNINTVESTDYADIDDLVMSSVLDPGKP